MTDAELGQATIVYEDPEDGTVERTVDNEYVAYFQDHWIVKMDDRAETGEGDGEGDSQAEGTPVHEDGPDLVRRIPATRVYYVERNVEEFEEEIRSLRDQVQSVATDIGGEVRTLRNRIESVASGFQQGRSGDEAERDADEERGAEPIEIEVEGDEGRSATDANEDDDVEESDVDQSL